MKLGKKEKKKNLPLLLAVVPPDLPRARGICFRLLFLFLISTIIEKTALTGKSEVWYPPLRLSAPQKEATKRMVSEENGFRGPLLPGRQVNKRSWETNPPGLAVGGAPVGCLGAALRRQVRGGCRQYYSLKLIRRRRTDRARVLCENK